MQFRVYFVGEKVREFLESTRAAGAMEPILKERIRSRREGGMEKRKKKVRRMKRWSRLVTRDTK